MNELREALLEAHVQHELDSFRGEALTRAIQEEVSCVFDWLAGVRLNDVANRDQIVGVCERYVINFRISGGITELAGEMSERVFSSPLSEATRLEEIVASKWFGEVVDKVIELEGARREIAHILSQSSAYTTLVARVLHGGILDFVFRRAEPASLAPRGLSLLIQAGRRAAKQLIPGVEKHIAARLSACLSRSAEQFARESEPCLLEALDAKQIRRAANEIWDSLASMRLSEAFAYLGSHDLDEFVVLGHELWLRFRKTRYFREILVELIGHFFDKYGDDSLLSLVEDMGVSKEMVIQELQVFAGPLFAHALSSGYLESRIRARLEPFYASEALAAVLSRAHAGSG